MSLDNSVKTAGDALLQMDEAVQALFRPYAETAAIKALHPISKLADQPQLRTLCAALIAGGMVMRNRRLVNAGCRMIIAHEAATFAKDALKTEIERTRPRSADDRREKKPRPGKRQSKEVTSFPSGHSAGAIAVGRAFSREFPEHGAAAVGAATALALLQIPRCAHYVTDVIAGLGLGVAAEKATDLLWSVTVGDGSADKEEQNRAR